MPLMEIELRPEKGQLRVFGLALAIILAVLAWRLHWAIGIELRSDSDQHSPDCLAYRAFWRPIGSAHQHANAALVVLLPLVVDYSSELVGMHGSNPFICRRAGAFDASGGPAGCGRY